MINDDLPPGATPLTADDAHGLIPEGITTRGQMNQFESRNIQQAIPWAFRSRHKPSDLLTIDYCLQLHKRMFDKTWEWAGAFRRYEVNIGNTAPERVPMQLKNLCDDVLAWIEFNTFSKDEICIRLHHRMVYIHPFANGNGRHSRIMADLLLKTLNQPKFTWGNYTNLTLQSKSRTEYLVALRLADQSEFKPLLTFARS